MGKLLPVLVAVASLSSQTQRVYDLAVFNVLSQADHSLSKMTIWHRVPVTPELDLVLAMGATDTIPFGGVKDELIWWGETRKLGFFLQNRSEPGQVFSLAIEAGLPDCAARVLRATATDTVISCRGEKSERYPHQKFVYDVRAKRLVSRFSYAPFLMFRASATRGGATVVGTDGTRRLNVDFMPARVPEFRIVAATKERQTPNDVQTPTRTFAAARFGPSGAFRFVGGEIVESRGARQRSYRLPVSTYEEFQKARPDRVRDNYSREDTSFADEVGPWQLDGDTLWFGKTFYDGEGVSGVGGLGYFDVVERTYRLFTSPVIADASVSAIHVEPDAVWLALVGHGEYGDAGGGVVRFDRESKTFQEFRTADIGRAFVRVGDQLLLATDAGISVLRGSDVKEYIVDRTTDGRLRIAARDR